jgi:preprotein translocase subunit YajC
MFKTILAIIISVTFLGVFFFIIVRNLLKRKLDQLIEDEKKRKLNDLE